MIYKPNVLLCFSSASFILTSWYGYKKQQYMYQFDFVSALCSLLYWCDPNNTYKRIVDVGTANIASIVFFTHMYKNTNGKMRYLMWFNVGGVVTCFTLSCVTSRIKYNNWHHFHFLFHMFVIGTKMLAYNTNLLL